MSSAARAVESITGSSLGGCWKGCQPFGPWGGLCFCMMFSSLPFFLQPEAGLDPGEVAGGPCEGLCSLKPKQLALPPMQTLLFLLLVKLSPKAPAREEQVL